MPENISALTKDEILKRWNYRCRHRMTGLTHPNCYYTERGEERDKIGFLDIESSNLNANFGIVLSYCIKSGDNLIANVITPEEIKSGTFDKRLMQDIVKDVLKFDRIVTYYGARFDIPFIRTRCLYHGVEFPGFKAVYQTDLYDTIKRRFRFHRNGLAVACDFFGILAKTHPLKGELWLKCLSGDKKSLDYVLEHNIEDVDSTERLWHKVQEHIRIIKSSI